MNCVELRNVLHRCRSSVWLTHHLVIIRTLHSANLAMVVYLPLILQVSSNKRLVQGIITFQSSLTLPHVVNATCKKNINKWDGEVEEEPHLNHLDIRGDWKASNHGDEHAGQDQHHGQVHSNHGLKIKRFEVVRDVSNNIE